MYIVLICTIVVHPILAVGKLVFSGVLSFDGLIHARDMRLLLRVGTR